MSKEAPKTEGIVVGSEKRRWLPRFKAPKSKRTQLVVLLIIGVVVFGGTAGVLYYVLPEDKDTSTEQAGPTQDSSREPTAYEEASAIAFNGDYEGSQAYLDEKIEESESDQEKASLYVAKTNVASESSNNDEALDYARKAYELEKNQQTTVTYAYAAEQAGDTATAVKMYKEYLQYFEQASGGYNPRDYEYYKRKVAELES